MFGGLSVNYGETTEWIFMKFGIHTGYQLTWVVGLFISQESWRSGWQKLVLEIEKCIPMTLGMET